VQLDGRYRFDNYVVGSANRLAVAAAQAVAEAPATSYNPLFIHGPPGLGKTHLLSAIGCHAVALQPMLRVDAMTLDEFVRHLHAAVSAGQTESFRERHHHAQLLLIDDVQFLSGRRETQSELLRLCQATEQDWRQVVVTSDRPPADMADVDERLLRKLEEGLLVEIGAPDFEARVAMLRTWAGERGTRFAPGVIEAVGRIDVGNVRDLQGLLGRLVAFQSAERPDHVTTVADVQRLFPDRADPGPPVEADPASADPSDSEPSDVDPTVDIGRGSESEYLSFLSDVAHVVAQYVEPWRTRLAEAVAYWASQGYRVTVLEQALRANEDPDAEGVVAVFEATVERLRALEAEAEAMDPAMGGSEVFRDPERLVDAETVVAEAYANATPEADAPPIPAAGASPAEEAVAIDPFFLDEEKIVWDWPEPAGRAIEELR
jgi:chromosomal replication initiator protein